MAANAFANIAAATAAGYKLERTVLLNGNTLVKLSKAVSGIQGQSGRYVEFCGENAVQATADTAALTNLNRWRDNRYGPDSAASSVSPTPDSATSPSTQGTTPTHRTMTKDSH